METLRNTLSRIAKAVNLVRPKFWPQSQLPDSFKCVGTIISIVPSIDSTIINELSESELKKINIEHMVKIRLLPEFVALLMRNPFSFMHIEAMRKFATQKDAPETFCFWSMTRKVRNIEIGDKVYVSFFLQRLNNGELNLACKYEQRPKSSKNK